MKFIQIATAAYVNAHGESFTPLYALGDDGSVWELHPHGHEWRRVAASDNTGIEKKPVKGARP
jgi:hypothetical protein